MKSSWVAMCPGKIALVWKRRELYVNPGLFSYVHQFGFGVPSLVSYKSWMIELIKGQRETYIQIKVSFNILLNFFET